MSAPQVGQGDVAIVPVFKGFRRVVSAEVDGAADAASSGFKKRLSRGGTDSGKATGVGFKKAFESASDGFSSKATRQLEQDVAKAARAMSAARLKEQDAAGKARVAERQLAEARQKYAADSSRVVAAEERLQSANRNLSASQERTESSTKELKDAQQSLARAANRTGDELAESGRRGSSGFRTNLLEGIRGLAGPIAAVIATLGIGRLIGNAVRTGFNFLKDSVTQASDLNESLNAVSVAYGDIGKEIEKLGKGAATRLGLSQVDFNAIATQFSSFAQTIRGTDVAGFIDELTTRGADFASVFNIEVSEALALFQSGLAGETEPLRRYGLDLSAATVEAWAYANGVAAAGEPLSEAQKQQARYGALLEQTSKVQGDFNNTSGELANQQRILAAEWENSQAKLGMALLPALTTLANLANTTLVPILNQVIDQVGPLLGDALEQATPAIVELVEAIVPLIPEMVRLAVEILPPMIELFTLLAPAIQWVVTGWADFWSMLSSVLGFLSGDTTLEEFAGEVDGTGNGIFQLAKTIGTALGEAIAWFTRFSSQVSTTVGTVIGFVLGLRDRVVGAISGIGSWLYNAGRDLLQGLIDGVKSMLGRIGETFSGVMDFIGGFFPHSPAKRGQFAGAGWSRLRESGAATIKQWASGMRRDSFSGALPGAVPAVASASASAGFPSMMVLRVDGHDFRAYVEERADARVGAYDHDRTQERVHGFIGEG